MIAHLPPPPPANVCQVPAPYKAAPDCEPVWTWTTIVPAEAQPPRPPIVRTALVPEIARTTRAMGWPHPWQDAEQGATMWHVGRAFLRGATGSVACTFPRAGRARCTVVRQAGGKVRAVFSVSVRAWEDGAIRMSGVRR